LGAIFQNGAAVMTAQVFTDSPRQQLLASIPVREHHLQLAGVSTAVLEGGDGSPLVLLHGPAGNATHWMGVIPGLTACHRVIVPDLPGHGASLAAESALAAAPVLAWLDQLIRRTCESPPVLVGQTLGGAIATRFAISRTARVEGLVLIDTFGLAPLQLPPDFAQALSKFLAHADRHSHEALWRHCAFDLDALRERMLARWKPFETYNVERARDPAVQAAVSALVREFGAAIPVHELERIGVPTTLVWGRHDAATPFAVAEAAAARYGWPLHAIEDAADDPPVEQPEAVLRALLLALQPMQRVLSPS
jgi:pimeloyl-ACP methyl ester carboxylesterase